MKNKKQKIAIYGGSFDPLHFGHVDIVKNLEKTFDKVIVVPSYISPFKTGADDANARFRLCKKALASEKTEVSRREISRGGTSYSVDTAAFFAKKYKDAELYFVIGSEELNRLHEWKDPERLKSLVTFYVVPRPRYEIPQNTVKQLKRYKFRIKTAKFVGLDISSTKIKLDIAFGKPNSGMPWSVYEYAKKNGLFNPYGEYVKGLYAHGLNSRRIEHSYRVAIRGAELAKLYGESVIDAVTACVLHDIGKAENISDYADKVDLSGYPNRTEHAPIGAYIAKTEYGVSDEIANAIAVHSTGSADMTMLDMIVYLADKTESGRTYKHADYVRFLSELDCNLAMLYALDEIGKLDDFEANPHSTRALDYFKSLCGNTEYPEMQEACAPPAIDDGSNLPSVRGTREVSNVGSKAVVVANGKDVVAVPEKSKAVMNVPEKAPAPRKKPTVEDDIGAAIAETAAAELDLHKAHDIDIIDLAGKTVIADYFVIASASSTTAVQALYGYVDDRIKKQFGLDPLRRDIDREWIALDYGDVIVHIFTDKTREFYNIERLWSDGSNVTRRGE